MTSRLSLTQHLNVVHICKCECPQLASKGGLIGIRIAVNLGEKIEWHLCRRLSSKSKISNRTRGLAEPRVLKTFFLFTYTNRTNLKEESLTEMNTTSYLGNATGVSSQGWSMQKCEPNKNNATWLSIFNAPTVESHST